MCVSKRCVGQALVGRVDPAGWPECELCKLPLNIAEPHEQAYGGLLHVGCCRIWDLDARGMPLSA